MRSLSRFLAILAAALIILPLVAQSSTFAPVPKVNGKTPIAVVPQEDMIEVQGGSFTMGSASGDVDEQPAHAVTLSSFYISKYEVTFDEYDMFCISTGRAAVPDYKQGRGKKPVGGVTWYDAVEFANWMSDSQGLAKAYTIVKAGPTQKDWTVSCDFAANGYRLPTEAEWEFAATGRGLVPTDYSGNPDLSVVGWFGGNSDMVAHEVGLKAANSLGIFDMSGNVWEWCWDWYAPYPASKVALKDYKGPEALPAAGAYKALRGGAWGRAEYYNRVTYRLYNAPDRTQTKVNGLRLVRSSLK